MRSLALAALALAAAGISALVAAGCSDVPLPPEYLGVLDGGPAKPASSVLPLTPDAAAPTTTSGTVASCAGNAASMYGALLVAGGAAYADGQLFVAVGEGVQRFPVDAKGCPTAPSSAPLATALAPVQAVAVGGGQLFLAGTTVAVATTSGDAVTSCAGGPAQAVRSLAITADGGAVGANGGSSLSFFSATSGGGCTAQSAEVRNADGSSFGPVRAVAVDGSLLWMAQMANGVAQVQSGHRSADGTTVTIDMPLAALTDVCSIDALAIVPGAGAPHVVVADDTCRTVREYATDSGITLVSSTPMAAGHAVRSLVAVPGSSALLAVGVAPASTGSVVVFDVVSLP